MTEIIKTIITRYMYRPPYLGKVATVRLKAGPVFWPFSKSGINLGSGTGLPCMAVAAARVCSIKLFEGLFEEAR